jgi:Skp family chaperone for outer membrane proteins
MRLVPAVLVTLALGVAAATTVHSQSQPVPNQVGFVDVERVLQEYRKRESVEKELSQRADQLKTEFKRRRNEIEAKRDKLATLAEGSEEALRLEREVDIDLLTWKRDQEYEDRRLKAEQNKRIGMLYRELCAEVRAQAEQRGLAAVYAWDPLPAGFETKMNALAVVERRDVLWADSRLELTNQVIEALNAQLPATGAPVPASGGK